MQLHIAALGNLLGFEEVGLGALRVGLDKTEKGAGEKAERKVILVT
jgi:hypothetical protein